MRRVTSAAHAEEALMKALYDEHAGALWRYALRLTGEASRAEDVVQETLLRAWQHPEVIGDNERSARLLEHAGFAIEVAFTADVHANRAGWFTPLAQCRALLKRSADLGQYLFVRARRDQPPRTTKPAWLYRSYPAAELE